jgi:hypothetical protein
MLTIGTPLYVTSKDGTSQMAFRSVVTAFNGGMKWEEVEITTEPEESKRLEQKRLAMIRTGELLRNMTPEQVNKAVDSIQDREDLITLEEGYA